MRLDNSRHEAFARYVAAGHFASRAYKLAGYTARGHSAESCASRLLRNVQVRKRIDELRYEAEAGSGIPGARAIRGLAQIGFANILDVVDVDPVGLPVPNLTKVTPDQAASVADVKVEQFKEGRGKNARPVRRITIRLHDKTRALGRLADMLLNLRENPGKPG